MDIKKEKSKIQLDVHTHTVMSGHAFSTVQEMVHEAAAQGLKILGQTSPAPVIPYTSATCTWFRARCMACGCCWAPS